MGNLRQAALELGFNRALPPSLKLSEFKGC
jgi:hypothetical protein